MALGRRTQPHRTRADAEEQAIPRGVLKNAGSNLRPATAPELASARDRPLFGVRGGREPRHPAVPDKTCIESGGQYNPTWRKTPGCYRRARLATAAAQLLVNDMLPPGPAPTRGADIASLLAGAL